MREREVKAEMAATNMMTVPQDVIVVSDAQMALLASMLNRRHRQKLYMILLRTMFFGFIYRTHVGARGRVESHVSERVEVHGNVSRRYQIRPIASG